jgi:hypothetical protein
MVVREERQGAESKDARAKGGTGARTLCTALGRALSVLCCRVETRARRTFEEQARLDKRVTACAPWSRSAQRSCPSSRFPAAFTQAPGGCKPPDRPAVLTSAARGVQLRRSMRVPMHGRSALIALLRAQRQPRRATGPRQVVVGRARLPAAESLRKSETPCTQPPPLLPGGKRNRQTTSSRPLRQRPP